MNTLGRCLLLGSLLISGAACDDSSPTTPSTDRDRSGSPSASPAYEEEAAALLDDLNERLEPSLRCEVYAPHLSTGYAQRVPNLDAAACRFRDGTPLFALIVRDGDQTYRRYFGEQRGPNEYLRGRNWLVVAPLAVPREALEVLREDFGGAGE